MTDRPTVAILGVGEIGMALAQGLLKAGWGPTELSLAVRRSERAEEVGDRIGCQCVLEPRAAVGNRDVVVVAVKPQDVSKLLRQIAGSVATPQVLLSLAAGVPTQVFEAALGQVPVVRAMPNTPALVGEGMTGMAPGLHAETEHLTNATTVLGAVGEVEVMAEELLDAVTAVSGTGPAYGFLMAEALTDAAVREGLPRRIAEKLVHQTLRGAGTLLIEGDKSPRELREQVTSPGGTTAAAVHVLEAGGFQALLEDAVRAAAKRSRELGKLEE